MRLVLRNDLFLKGSVAYNSRAKWETTSLWHLTLHFLYGHKKPQETFAMVLGICLQVHQKRRTVRLTTSFTQ